MIQHFWDQRGKHSQIMLVLCGSQVSFMEKEVLAERSPLFGRRTAQRRLEPLEPSETLAFFPNWPVSDAVLAYGILGGMPAYLRRFDDGSTLTENLMREVLRPEGYLFDEVQFLLRSELHNPATYNSILAACARGSERVGDIALSVGVDSPTANKYLHVLRELRIVEREIPITDPDPLRSRKGTYRIADRFLAFHFRHVQPHLSLIEAGRGARVLEEFIQPDYDRIAAEARADFMLEHLRRDAADLIGEEVGEVGRFPGRAVRAVGRTVEGRGVAAIDAEVAEPIMVEDELSELAPSFGDEVVRLAYRLTEDSRKPPGCDPASPGGGFPMTLDKEFNRYFQALDRAGNEDRCFLCRRSPAEVKAFFGFHEDGTPIDADQYGIEDVVLDPKLDIMSYSGERPICAVCQLNYDSIFLAKNGGEILRKVLDQMQHNRDLLWGKDAPRDESEPTPR